MKRGLVIGVLIVAIVGVAGFGAWANTRSRAEPRFCKMGLAGRDVDGHGASLEDQGDPGRDHCDIDAVPDSDYDVIGDRGDRGGLVLGYDCAVRDRDGEVVVTAEPNRADGTCGQDDP